MPVLAITEVTGLPRDEYTRIATALTDQIKAAPGFMGHCAYENNGTVNVLEVWASREEHDAWVNGTVRPNLPQDVNANPKVFELLNMILPDTANQPTG